MSRPRRSLLSRLWHEIAVALGLRRRTSSRTAPRPTTRPARYPGDYRGKVDIHYAPRPDGAPDPGEVVWTWVPFEEDHSRGKDRPVLLIGRDGRWLLGLQLSSQEHVEDPRHVAQRGRRWLDIGSGPWDRRGRPSQVRLDRIVRVDPGAVRREGATLNRRQFDEVSRSLSERHRW